MKQEESEQTIIKGRGQGWIISPDGTRFPFGEVQEWEFKIEPKHRPVDKPEEGLLDTPQEQ